MWLSTGRYASLVAQRLKRLPAMQETQVRSLGWEDPLEKEMATHSSTLAWRIPWREEPGRLQSTGLQRVRHNWATSRHFSLRLPFQEIFPRLMIFWLYFLTFTPHPTLFYKRTWHPELDKMGFFFFFFGVTCLPSSQLASLPNKFLIFSSTPHPLVNWPVM